MSQPLNRPKIVILGASGQIGSVVFRRLCLAFPQADIIGCVRNLGKPIEINAHANYLQFDPFHDNWGMLGKITVLINSIGIIEEKPGMGFQKVHQGLTDLMLQHRAQLGNPKLIQVSVLGADTESPSAFLRTKALADETLLKHPNTVVIRPSIVCTPNTVMVQKLRMLGKISLYLAGYLPFPRGFANTRIQPILGDELADLMAVLCRHNQHPSLIQAVGPVTFSIRHLIGQLCKKPIRLLPIPQTLFDQAFKVISFLLPKLLNREQFQLLKHDNIADAAVCEDLLGKPLSSTETFWKEELGSEPFVKSSSLAKVIFPATAHKSEKSKLNQFPGQKSHTP
ncbi:MAG: hypothetical protein V4714_21530 [Bacteroidota bacterium]